MKRGLAAEKSQKNSSRALRAHGCFTLHAERSSMKVYILYVVYTSKYIFRHPIYHLHRPVLSLPLRVLIVVTQIQGHTAGSSPPLPTTVRALHFYRDKISPLSSLVDSRRIVLTHARRSQQLILFFILANKFKISPRRDSNSRANTSSIRGLPTNPPGRPAIHVQE